MKIAMIAAMAADRVIGKDNKMPWHMPADLQHFKAVTLGKPVVMGRKTFESIGKPLPGRRNLVLSRTKPQDIAGVEWINSVDEALALLAGAPEIMIIGGAELYRQCLPIADRLYLTLIDAQLDGDTHFPDYSANEWQTVSEQRSAADERNPYAYRFITLERRRDDA